MSTSTVSSTEIEALPMAAVVTAGMEGSIAADRADFGVVDRPGDAVSHLSAAFGEQLQVDVRRFTPHCYIRASVRLDLAVVGVDGVVSVGTAHRQDQRSA